MVRWSSLLLPIAIGLGVLIFAAGTGAGIAYAVFEPPKSRAEARVEQRQIRIDELESEVAAREQRIEELLAAQGDLKQQLAEAQATIGGLETAVAEERAGAQRAKAAVQEANILVAQRDERIAELEEKAAEISTLQDRLSLYESALEPVDPDRLLLIELRKDPPGDREAAREYWENVKELAVQSDPSLGPKADRVLRLIPTYFDYIEAAGEAQTCEGIFDAYFTSGVIDYFSVESDFERDLYLVLINRLDSLIVLTEE